MATAVADDALEFHPTFRLRLRQQWSENVLAKSEDGLRLRLEVGMTAHGPRETARIVIGTGRPNSPADAEARLGENVEDLPITLRVASIAWRPSANPAVPNLIIGKMEPPFVRPSDLIWDEDVRPEGVAAQWRYTTRRIDGLGTIGAFPLHSEVLSHPTWIYSVQTALRHRWPDRSWFMGGAGLWYIKSQHGKTGTNSAGDCEASEPIFTEIDRPLEGFLAGCWELYFPVQVFGHGVYNSGAEHSNTAWSAGLVIGRAQAVHGLELSAQWRRVESQAVVSTFTGDAYGAGPDRSEWRLTLRYRLWRGVLASLIASHAHLLREHESPEWRIGLELEVEWGR